MSRPNILRCYCCCFAAGSFDTKRNIEVSKQFHLEIVSDEKTKTGGRVAQYHPLLTHTSDKKARFVVVEIKRDFFFFNNNHTAVL